MTYENSFTGSIRPYQIQRKHAGAEPTRTHHYHHHHNVAALPRLAPYARLIERDQPYKYRVGESHYLLVK